MNINSFPGFIVAATIGLLLSCLLVTSTVYATEQRKARHRTVNHPVIGHQVRTLPQGHQSIRVNRNSYRYYNGDFYRPASSGSYVVVRAPLGARVRSLPVGFVGFAIGPSRYYYANYTYYRWDKQQTEYIVVEEPEGAEAALVTASKTDSSEIFVYPNKGQSDEQRERDRYQCYVWAVEQTGYDPAAGKPAVGKAGDYRRASSACLEGRGYTVK